MLKGESLTQTLAILPNLDEISRLLTSTGRPFVVATERELSVLRRGLTKDGWKRSLYLQDAPADTTLMSGAGLLASANAWLEKDVVIPAPGGSCRDFFCSDGTPLAVPDGPDISGASYVCPACGRTYSGDEFDAALRRIRHAELATGCFALALIYQLDRDAEYAEKAAEILIKYAEVCDGLMHKSADNEAEWLISLAQAYDLIYHVRLLTPAERETVENGLLRPAAKRLLDIERIGRTSPWNIAAAGVVGCSLKDPQLVLAAVRGFAEQININLDNDGLWPKSTGIPHFSAITAYVHLAEACCRMGIDLYNYCGEPNKSLKSMFMSPPGYVYPSFQIPAFGDGCFRSVIPLSLYEVAFRRWGDMAFARVLKTGYGFSRQPTDEVHIVQRHEFTRNGFYAFLFGRDLPNRIQEPRPVSVAFEELGVCVLRGYSDSMLTLSQGGGCDGTHSDQMSMSLYANGRLLCPDYGAGKPAYLQGAISHNLVVVDEKPLTFSDSFPRLADFSPGEYLQKAVLQTSISDQDVTHVRSAILAGDLVVLQDRLEGETEHSYDWLLRCEGSLCDKAKGNPVDCFSEHFSEGQKLAEGSSFDVRWHNGNSGLSVYLNTDPHAQLISALTPAETVVRQVSLIDLQAKGTAVRYLAVLVPYADDAPSMECSGRVMKITRGDVIDWIYCRDVPQEWSGPSLDLETDAEFAAVRMSDGEIVACGLYNGSFVTLGGEAIILSGGRFDRIEMCLDRRNPIVEFDNPSGGYLTLKCHSRAMLVNGNRISATGIDGMATIKLVGVLAEV